MNKTESKSIYVSGIPYQAWIEFDEDAVKNVVASIALGNSPIVELDSKWCPIGLSEGEIIDWENQLWEN